MDFLHAEIGSAKDNFKSPIHNWYKFTAGFSYKFVDEVIKLEGLKNDSESKIFDPFAGCGTTLVSSQKVGVNAIGNEGQKFMYDVIKAKLNWKINKEEFEITLRYIQQYIQKNKRNFNWEIVHPLLRTLYGKDTLLSLYLIRNSLNDIAVEKYHSFFKLALSQTLHKVSIHPIAVPYISRNKTLNNNGDAWEAFEGICRRMLADLTEYSKIKGTSKVYLHDSRKENKNIENSSCSTCITSPPYLNNLDYGEVSKVHTHFFEYTNNWNDITQKVRKKLVTGATTHYTETSFDISSYKKTEFFNLNKKLVTSLIETTQNIKEISAERSGKKSFDILTLLYFMDMFDVLKETRRIINPNGKAYLILGDSAPYGVHIPTTELLGKISLNAGFKKYDIQKIRSRGTKWKSLKHRHSLELTENVLILK